MNVIVVIEGREAIPVRAIPLLTNWSSMSPDVIAKVLARNDDVFGFEGLQAYRCDAGVVSPIPAIWWKRFCVRELKALSELISSTQAGRETQYVQWREESLVLLPAGAFVWKDEYMLLHESNWGLRQRNGLQTAWSVNQCEERGKEVDESEAPSFKQINAMRQVGADYESWRVLDFNPFIPSMNRKKMVMEGFVQQLANTQPQTATVEPEPPVVEVPDPERRLAALRALGGTAKWKRRKNESRWVFTGIKGLMEQEKGKGHKRSDEKTIRLDLIEAAEAENMAKRSGEPWNR